MKFFFHIKDMNHKNFAILQKHIAATENVEQYRKKAGYIIQFSYVSLL